MIATKKLYLHMTLIVWKKYQSDATNKIRTTETNAKFDIPPITNLFLMKI